MPEDISLTDLTKAATDKPEQTGAQLTLSDIAGARSPSATTTVQIGEDLEQSDKDDVGDQIARLPQEDQQLINQLSGSIDLIKPGIESSYAKDVQRTTSSFADDVLARVHSRDTGQAGELLSDLLVTVDNAELGPIHNIPLIGGLLSGTDKLRRRYQKVSS